MAQTERLAQLRQNLVETYNDEELRTLCFDLGVDYDNLPGRAKADKARELLSDLDRRSRIRDLIKFCSTQRPNVPWQEIIEAAEAEPPFKGLQYFDEADADLFFGREVLTAQLVERLQGTRFLAVVGASGSGKSSVVRAGLVPALKRGAPLADGTLPPDGSTRWPVHVITPGAHPLKELAASLTRDSESVTATATLMDDLARDTRSLDLAVTKLLKRPGSGDRLLLVVDQFEELFTACKDQVERKALVDNLLHATAPDTEGRTMIVIALRADFYAHCGQYDNLREALAKHQEYTGPMSADELRHAIKEPARRNGCEFEPGLVDLILRDVGDEPGALPLLSHALLETWQRRHGRTLTLEGYHDSGGVRGAIAQTADALYNQLSPEQQAIARNIFLRLTELGEGTQDTRRRAALTELVPRPEDNPAVEAVLKRLAGRYERIDEPPEGSRAARLGAWSSPRVTERGIAAARQVAELARQHGLTSSQLALVWVKDQPVVTAPIIGPRTEAHLDDALPVLELKLSSELAQAMDGIVPPGNAVADFHNMSGWMKMKLAV